MTEKAISPLRRRLIEDMAIRRLDPKTQQQYIRHVKKFADFVGRSAEKATPEDVRRYQVWLASIGTTVGTVNAGASALRFFFKVTLKRPDLAEEIVSTREPRRLPVVLSPEEVGRLLASTTNIKHRAILSLAYATGLRASEVVSLSSSPISIVTGCSSGSSRARARRIGTSFSRPSFLRYCMNGGASRARRAGCLPLSPGCFPATAGVLRARPPRSWPPLPRSSVAGWVNEPACPPRFASRAGACDGGRRARVDVLPRILRRRHPQRAQTRAYYRAAEEFLTGVSGLTAATFSGVGISRQVRPTLRWRGESGANSSRNS